MAGARWLVLVAVLLALAARSPAETPAAGGNVHWSFPWSGPLYPTQEALDASCTGFELQWLR